MHIKSDNFFKNSDDPEKAENYAESFDIKLLEKKKSWLERFHRFSKKLFIDYVYLI